MYEVIACVVVLVLFSPILALILRRFSAHEQKYIILAFFVHIAATLAQIWMHVYYYGYGDMLTYFREGMATAELLRHDFSYYAPELFKVIFHQQPDVIFPISGIGHSTGTLGATASFLAFFTSGSLYASCLVVSLVAYLGLVALYAAFPPAISKTYQTRLLISCLLIPSVVFWSSGIIKEAIALAGLGFATFGLFKIIQPKLKASVVLLLATGLIMVGLTKSYLIGPFILASVAWFYVTKNKDSKLIVKPLYLILILVLGIIAVIGIGKLFPRYALDNLATEISNQQVIVQSQNAGSSSAIFESTKASAGTQFRNLPIAIFSVLLRPFIFEVHNIMALINALETTYITALLFLIARRRTFREITYTISNSPMLVFCLVFTALCAVGVGLTTVNLGTLSRYRMPLMPLYVILVFALVPVKKPLASMQPKDERVSSGPLRGT